MYIYAKSCIFARDIIILHLCIKNHDHMRYSSWDMKWDRIFCPFIQLLTQKIKIWKKCKKYLGIFWFYICVPQMTIIWCMVSEIWSTTDIIFFILGYFCPFTPLTTQKRKILKKWKKRMEMSFYKCAPWMTTIWCMIPEIWSTHNENNFSHFGPFFALFLP